MSSAVFLATPPFTQLNTPYPATSYLKGFLNTLEVKSRQADLGLDLILKLFSKEGLSRIFNAAEKHKTPSENSRRIIALRDGRLVYNGGVDGIDVDGLVRTEDPAGEHDGEGH